MSPPEIDIAALRRARRLVPLAPLTPFDAEPWSAAEDFVRFADNMLRRGWAPPGDRLASLTPPIPWSSGGRSFAMHVHAWLPLKDVLAAHHATRERRYLDAALAVALDWIAVHPTFAPRGRDAGDGSEDGFAWYDQAVGLRLCRLAYILDAACREDDIGDDALAALIASFHAHRTAIADDREFRKNTNHGLYQALGQLSAATRLPELAPPEFLAQANARLSAMLEQQYFPEGMHREHSPGYHFATWRAISAAIADGIIREPNQVALLSNVEAGLSWLFDAQARIATIGDTDPWTAPPPERLEHIRDERLRSVLRRERNQAETLKGFAQSGYASVQHFRGGHGSFLLQTGGFHSPTHKHADHLSFVWSEGEAEILIDPGRWGYRGRTPHDSELFRLGFWYDAPERIFVESTHAHNVVQPDGREFPRRGVRPFGSALQSWGEAGGLYYILSRAPLVEHAVQRRLLVLSPGDFLLVFDLVADRVPRSWRQWFHLGAGFTAESDGAAVRARNGAGLALSTVPLVAGQHVSPVMCGQNEPFVQGWWCPSAGTLAPAPAFSVEAPAAQHTHFATLFALAGDVRPGKSRIDGDLQNTSAALSWVQNGIERTLSLAIEGPGRVRFGAAPRRSWLSRLIK